MKMNTQVLPYGVKKGLMRLLHDEAFEIMLVTQVGAFFDFHEVRTSKN